ncbi:hypothetical protein FQA47_015944 [Oryzias melastigma]|uniref:Uncharacterized protein n=1 Tax=Oryzias melastigma TaxID=30732 RepID=A0A834C066_ORYME|nr:hypothetical protein FQA47_015944 [Oryzias melastigma]
MGTNIMKVIGAGRKTIRHIRYLDTTRNGTVSCVRSASGAPSSGFERAAAGSGRLRDDTELSAVLNPGTEGAEEEEEVHGGRPSRSVRNLSRWSWSQTRSL